MNERMAALFIIGLILFNYPVLSLTNHNIRLVGIPFLYLYLFVVWLVIIVFLALLLKSKAGMAHPSDNGEFSEKEND